MISNISHFESINTMPKTGFYQYEAYMSLDMGKVWNQGTNARSIIMNGFKYYPEIDVITTPTGSPAALIHNNTCTSVINDWVNLFNQVLETFDVKVEKGELFEKLFNVSKKSEDDLGNVISYNFKAGEPIAKTSNGAPMIAVKEEGNLSLDGIQINLIDTAGIHETNDVVEKIGVDKTIKVLSEAELIILVLDNSKELNFYSKN